LPKERKEKRGGKWSSGDGLKYKATHRGRKMNMEKAVGLLPKNSKGKGRNRKKKGTTSKQKR